MIVNGEGKIGEKILNKYIISKDDSANLQNFTNNALGFTIDYPLLRKYDYQNSNWVAINDGEEWIAIITDEVKTSLPYYGNCASFKPEDFSESIWGVCVYDKDTYNLEESIKIMGKQFEDRNETREDVSINGVSGILVTVSTQQYQTETYGFLDWISKRYYLFDDEKVYLLTDSTIHPEFKKFVESFKLL